MVRPSSPIPTEAERAILEVLWARKQASAREVTDALSETRTAAYTTVQTILKILERKGFVTHRSEGRTFVYCAAVTRAQARSSALRQLVGQFFGGSPKALAQHLLSEHEIDLAELEVLQAKIDAAQAKERKK
jgi:predicted transcriptional regulator